MPLANTLDEIRRYLENELAEGRTAVEASPEVVEEFKRLATQPRTQSASVSESERKPPMEGGLPVLRRETPSSQTPQAMPSSGALQQIAGEIAACTLCGLHETRTNTVPGQGCPRPEVMFIGEAPGYDEDQQGLAFVGKAGQLLTRMIEAMGFTREEVFIGNILKCRPPKNRKPHDDEMEACLPYLRRQISELQPKVIVSLGGTALTGLFGLKGITRQRGQWLSFEGIDTMPTFHPSYLLQRPDMTEAQVRSRKKQVWEDLQAVVHHLGRSLPQRKK